jgi:signal transduction histidine kinase
MFLPAFQKHWSLQSKVFSATSSRPARHKPFLVNSTLPSQPTILFLGDDNAFFSMTKELFESSSHILRSISVTETLNLLEDTTPDLVLCDLQDQLPLFLETFQAAQLADIPFLLLTAFEDRKANAALLAERVTDLLYKPCEAEEFKARIKGHLQNHLARKLLQNEDRHPHQSLENLAQDITARNKELCRMNKLKDEFMAVLSHELRNPINVIAGFAEILKSGVDQPDLAREAADAIFRNAQLQIKLVTDLFDISRGIAGKLVLDSKPMQMGAVLQEVLPVAKDAALKKGITLNVSSDAHGDMINGDSARISQVIWNLLTNAIKFTPHGGRIDVRLQRRDRWVELSVEDTGHGIDPSFLPCMFERFNQQDSSITKKFGGLGLGLAIVRHIVELHGGSVCAHSDGVDCGATFTVRLPVLTN